MKSWITLLIRDRALELAIALSLGYAFARLAEDLTTIPVTALAQHVSDEGGVVDLLNLFSSGVYLLNFRIGSTVIVYGQVLASTLALGLVLVIAWLLVMIRNGRLAVCSFCSSRIPPESRHCAYCGSTLVPAES